MKNNRESALLGKGEGEGPTDRGVLRSRMQFLIDGEWQRAKSWDEDVRDVKLKGPKEKAA